MSISLRRSAGLSSLLSQRAVLSIRRISFSLLASTLLMAGTSKIVAAQAATVTRLDKQLSRVDFAVSGVGLFNSTTTGTNYLKQTVSDAPGNTVGALVTLRYTVKPFVGFEGNYGYARYTQNFNTIGGVQSNVNEYTLGYVVHPADIFGVKPFASIGAGTIAFKPTPGGGQGLLTQARAAYYYSVGAEQLITEHFGVRVQFRQSIALAPDFGQNYLTIKQRTVSSEPGIGFYLHF